ncbi:MAG TPA: DUF167 domain-containing protein [Patescibacteria group bacterium]|nr:DUF167 domain-containing protein [Patescibacteria group bacterium]
MILTIHVQPNAKQTRLSTWLDENTVKICLAAPPRDGKANRELLLFLADLFKTPPSSLCLARGATGRIKWVKIPDATWQIYRKNQGTGS